MAGELDLATSSELDDVRRDAQHSARLVVPDLRGVTFVDSSAVHVPSPASSAQRVLSRRRGRRPAKGILGRVGRSWTIETKGVPMDLLLLLIVALVILSIAGGAFISPLIFLLLVVVLLLFAGPFRGRRSHI